MADTKAKVKRMGELQAILAGPEETSEIGTYRFRRGNEESGRS